MREDKAAQIINKELSKDRGLYPQITYSQITASKINKDDRTTQPPPSTNVIRIYRDNNQERSYIKTDQQQ